MISLSVALLYFTWEGSHHRKLASIHQVAWWGAEPERSVIHGFRAGRAPSGRSSGGPRPRGSAAVVRCPTMDGGRHPLLELQILLLVSLSISCGVCVAAWRQIALPQLG